MAGLRLLAWRHGQEPVWLTRVQMALLGVESGPVHKETMTRLSMNRLVPSL